MKTELSESINPLDQGRITEQEMTPLSEYDQGYNHGIELALEAKRIGLSDEEIIKRYRK